MSNIPLAERVRWVGASESAALFGVSPFITRFELWHQKAGNIPSADLDHDERVQAGRFLEPSIAAWAAEKWDWPVTNVAEYLPHPTVAHMGASLDFESETGEPVEIKNVDSRRFFDPASEWATEGEEVLDAPAHMLIQIQHQLACRPGPERGWLVACVGGNRLYRMPVPRHERMTARLEAEVDAFWRSIETGEEPQPDFEADAQAIALLYGGTGGESVDLRQVPRARMLCAEYLDAHEHEKAGKKRKQAALAELKTLMRDARSAIAADGFVVKANHVKGGTYTREPHWRFTVSRKEV